MAFVKNDNFESMQTEESTGGNYEQELSSDLLNKIATSNAYFKSQQIDDPELTYDEKHEIATKLFLKGPSQFLGRFYKHLTKNDIKIFERFRSHDYDVNFYLNEIENRYSKAAKCEVKNRRYEVLKKLIEKGQYFSDSEMKKRNPLMFEEMVGQYMTEEELDTLEKIDMSDCRFTTILMEHIDRDQVETLRKRQVAIEEEEEDSSEDEDKSTEEVGKRNITQEQKHLFREEFLSHMYRSFLNGDDEEFNYSSVDYNAEYDAVDEKQRDAEDNYFDEEEPQTVSNNETVAFPDVDYNVDLT